MNDTDAQEWLSSRVSRETMELLETYHHMLVRWQRTINLVAPSTLPAAWTRHFVDSAQLFDLAPSDARLWLDLGSGGGFPGLVVAAMAKDARPNLRVTLVESDIRKCGFMREVARALNVQATILPQRISDIPKQSADVVTARALAGLSSLIDHAKPHISVNTCLLFPKGESYQSELEAMPPHWQTRVETFQSVTDPAATILRMNVPDLEKEV